MPDIATPATAERLRLHQLANVDARAAFAADVARGLRAQPKQLFPKYFYDELGSVLFDAICLLPEYYLTRAEDEILTRYVGEIIAATGHSELTLMELGSGSATKTRRIIEALLHRQPQLRYRPIDISAAALETSARVLLQSYPALSVEAYASDYDTALAHLRADAARANEVAGRHTLALFLGSNVGNFDRADAVKFLRRLRDVLHDGDALLLGADLKKDPARLVAAYDDALGVTAAFNLNLLARINREFDADFDLRAFRHVARYDETHGRIELYLESRRAQDVHLPALDLAISFAAGELLHTENSYKYDLAELDELAARTGFARTRTWLDEGGQFSSNLFIAAAREGFPLLTDAVGPDAAPLFVENLRRGSKPAGEWMCGVEFELFGYDTRRDYARLTPQQVQRVLAGFAPSSNDLVYEGRTLVEVNAGQMNRLTVEPGGQIEFSGAPQRSLADVEREMRRYLARLREIADGHGFVFLACGFDPLHTLAAQQWFPKSRYDVMRPYLARRGARAWDMMTRTCAVQTNLDYGDEEDLRKKFLVGNRLAPVVAAVFANSPFQEGRPSGYKSTRTAAWLQTDLDRTGIAPPALADDFTPESFVAYALDVPMLFAQRDGVYLDGPTGMKFGDFLARRCDHVEPLFGDWADHLTTLFTDARLKQHIELRSADCGSLELALALQALWKGLFYDTAALDAALRLAPKLTHADATELRAAVARDGLAARVAGVNVLALAKEMITLAAAGLARIAPAEVSYLDVLRAQVVEAEVCPADILLRNWRGGWHGSMSKVVAHLCVN